MEVERESRRHRSRIVTRAFNKPPGASCAHFLIKSELKTQTFSPSLGSTDFPQEALDEDSNMNCHNAEITVKPLQRGAAASAS